MTGESKSTRKLPSWTDFKTYYRRRWRYANGVIGELMSRIYRRNASRVVLTLIVISAAIVGAIKVDIEPVLWPLALMLVGFGLSALWVWLASPCAVIRDLSDELNTLDKLVARQKIDAKAAEQLESLFFEGFELMQANEFDDQMQMLQWGDAYKSWRDKVAEFLAKVSREEQFMFLSAGFEYDVYIFLEHRSATETAGAVARALPAKMNKLRRIAGRTLRRAETESAAGDKGASQDQIGPEA